MSFLLKKSKESGHVTTIELSESFSVTALSMRNWLSVIK